MDTLEKNKQCLNCGEQLQDQYAFCPSCGQKNTDTNISFGQLVGDFFTNYFTLDSKFFRSILPFLFKPGWLTLKFQEGKRTSFVNPIRLYIIISFIYFFVLSFLASDLSEGIKSPDAAGSKVDSTQIETAPNVDSISSNSDLDQFPSLNKDKYVVPTESGTSITIDTSSGWPLSGQEWNIFLKNGNQHLSEEQLFDSLHVEYRSSFNQYLIKQMIRVQKSDKEFVFAFFIKNLSVMMFLMLPIFALILKLLYVRRKILYIKHLVHTLHIHSFTFLIYSLFLSISIWVTDMGWGELLAVPIVTVYAYLSFKRVYQQGHKKTLLKFLITGTLYTFLLFCATLAELFISLMAF